MNNTPTQNKEIKIPGPDHPITISPTEGTVRVTVAGRIVAESTRALQLEEKGYLSLTRRNNGPFYEVKSPGLRDFDCPIRFSHLRLLSIRINCLVFLNRNFGSSGCLTTQVCCSKGKQRAISNGLK
jgi:hypothetical protein